MANKRPYSRDFPADAAGEVDYYLTAPAGLWSAVKAKAAKQGVSVRSIILQLLSGWVAQKGTATRIKTPGPRMVG